MEDEEDPDLVLEKLRDQRAPDATPPVPGKHRYSAHVRVPRAVRDGAREADEARAVPGGNDVSGPGDLLCEARAVLGRVEPCAAEELRELLEVDVVRLAVGDHAAPSTSRYGWHPFLGQMAGGVSVFRV